LLRLLAVVVADIYRMLMLPCLLLVLSQLLADVYQSLTLRRDVTMYSSCSDRHVVVMATITSLLLPSFKETRLCHT